jgi:hypothetical protein
MALSDIRHEVVLALALTNEAMREEQRTLEAGSDMEKVEAAGELDLLHRQKRMLQTRLKQVDRLAAERESPFAWMRQEWFSLMLHFESWIAHG